MPENVLVERDGAIATVILNRPEKLNALTRPMWKRLGDAFLDLASPVHAHGKMPVDEHSASGR